jgi:hypothetical protein
MSKYHSKIVTIYENDKKGQKKNTLKRLQQLLQLVLFDFSIVLRRLIVLVHSNFVKNKTNEWRYLDAIDSKRLTHDISFGHVEYVLREYDRLEPINADHHQQNNIVYVKLGIVGENDEIAQHLFSNKCSLGTLKSRRPAHNYFFLCN